MVKVKNMKIPRKRLIKQEQLGQNMSRLKSDFVAIECAQGHNKRKKNTQKPKLTVKKDKKMIPKPAGSAGRDYNLQAAMGLSRNKKVYNAILCARKEADTTINAMIYGRVDPDSCDEDEGDTSDKDDISINEGKDDSNSDDSNSDKDDSNSDNSNSDKDDSNSDQDEDGHTVCNKAEDDEDNQVDDVMDEEYPEDNNSTNGDPKEDTGDMNNDEIMLDPANKEDEATAYQQPRRLICPRKKCNHSIAFPIPNSIKPLMDKYHLAKPSSYSRYSLKISICTEIARIRKLKATRHASELYGWPVDIDFPALPARIMKIKEVIQSRIARKGMDLPAEVTSLARPGYYGPKGSHIIEAVLLAVLDRKTINTDTFAPLSFSTFRKLYLIPLVATWLIAEDKSCSLKEAWDVMASSALHGLILQQVDGDDDELDEIVAAIYLGPSRTKQNKPTGMPPPLRPRPKPQPLKAKEASSTSTAIQSIPSTASVLLRSPAHPAGPQPSTTAPILPPRSRKFASLQTDHLPPASPKTGTPLEPALPISGVGVAGPSQPGPSHQTRKPSRLPSARLNLRSGVKQQQRSPAMQEDRMMSGFETQRVENPPLFIDVNSYLHHVIDNPGTIPPNQTVPLANGTLKTAEEQSDPPARTLLENLGLRAYTGMEKDAEGGCFCQAVPDVPSLHHGPPPHARDTRLDSQIAETAAKEISEQHRAEEDARHAAGTFPTLSQSGALRPSTNAPRKVLSLNVEH
ncbi:hypothetical protein EYR40_009154 [Pleurotus pulmonarius]|nr:hypothetical protein EYR40_009154 [Pleurotus pulmonarius]